MSRRVRVEVLTLERAEALADVLLGMNAGSDWDDWDRVNLLDARPEKWSRSLLVLEGERAVGYAVVSRRESSAHLHHIVVAPEARGGGLGSQLVRELLRRNADAGELTLKVHTDNLAARRLYERLGFAPRGDSSSRYVELGRACRATDEEGPVRIAVHQPNYMPWCGYFAKMFVCDAFVLFDDAQLPQGRSYVSRAKVAKGIDGEQWLTAPVQKSGLKAIDGVRFAEPAWAATHLRTLHHAYAKSRHYDEVIELLRPLYEDAGESLAAFNCRAIETVARYLGWAGAFHRASDHPSELAADQRLAQLVAAVGGSVYVSGAGGQNYQSEDVFRSAGLDLEVRAYVPVPYERSGWPFVPGLSILDALFHTGRGARAALTY